MTDYGLSSPIENEQNALRRLLPGREALTTFFLFVALRLALGLMVVLTIIFVSYLGFTMAGDTPFIPALAEAGRDTVTYLGNVLQGDFGITAAATPTALNLPVLEVLPGILGRSLGLLGVSLLFAAFVGVTLGVWAATRRHSNRSLPILLASIIGVSAPSFFVALLLQMLLIQWTRRMGGPLLPIGGFGWDKHLILPALVLAARPIAQITRVTFVTVGNVLSEDYVRTARSKGLRAYQVMGAHVFRNAAVPILTTVGLSLRFMLSSLPVVEFFFGWPGAGFTLLRAISRSDESLAIALLVSLGAFFVLVNVLLELAYRRLDPRLREIPDHISSGERHTLRQAFRNTWAELVDLVVNNPLRRWWRRWRAPAPANPFHAVLERNGSRTTVSEEAVRRFNWRAWRRGTVGNLPFVLGAALLALLLVVFLFGPQLAPHSPYTTQGLEFVDGEFRAPPFAPDEEFPWGTDVLGRDVMSLILAGAQQTLLLATMVVLVRMVLGFVLGAIAGWWNESWLDRLILGVAETVAAFPTLLLAMLFILALGIREGFRPFLIALSLIGWGEIMQYVRSEVMSLRPKPFIESAVAVGARTPRIIMNHVFPNLLSALISLAALEMGATLMLLGELGFIGIFIGGGAFAELEVFGAPYHYSDVPEWGSLLSNVRAYARSYPWTALYPASAFFVAILAFNLFGEGLRRLVHVVGVEFTRLLNRYTFAAALLLIVGGNWVRTNSGAMGFYRQQADAFEGQRALAHVQALADPALQGRALGSEGMDEAAAYIAGQFEELGLQPAGDEFTFFQNREREYQQLTATPVLQLGDGGPALSYREEYAEYPAPYRNLGEATGEVHFLSTGPLTEVGANYLNRRWPALEAYDFSDKVVLVPSPADVAQYERLSLRGMLVVAPDEVELTRRQTLSARDSRRRMIFTGEMVGTDTPIFWISAEIADRLLQGSGHTLAELSQRSRALDQDEVITFGTGVTATMQIEGSLQEGQDVVQVVGHLPGMSAELDSQMIVVLAQYDSPPLDASGVTFPAANNNASSIGIMLEMIRTMQETGYQPYKTFLFVAYAGEGWEGGNPVSPPDINHFLSAKYGFSDAFEVEAIVDLRGVGGGSGDNLAVAAGGSLRLADLVENAAGRMGVDTVRLGEAVDISIVFDDRSPYQGGQEAPQVGLRWQGWQETAYTPADTIDQVTAERLEQAGETLSLTLMTLGRETRY